MTSRTFPPASLRRLAAAGVAAAWLVAFAGCSGGGGGSGSSSFDRAGVLLSISFPDPAGVNSEPESTPPGDAPLVQQVVLTFSGNPNPDSVNSSAIQIRDPFGAPVGGSYRVDGPTVVFTPRLPLRPAVDTSGVIDNGGAGLLPGKVYSVRVGRATFGFVQSVAAELLAAYPDAADPNGILLNFQTTTTLAKFFRGLDVTTPRLLSVNPVDGSTNISPNLYGDPDDLFAERGAFRLEFDAPLHPSPDNLDKFLIIDLEDLGTGPSGLPLGFDARVIYNAVDRSVVELMPAGILPFGHMLSLEYPTEVAHLASAVTDPGEETTIASTFTVASAANDVRDLLEEDFDHDTREEASEELDLGVIPARWDQLDSNVLTATFAFEGAGELGRFVPKANGDGTDHRIIFDTSRMVFPLFDGSTPEAPPGFVVSGGVFPFTEIDIPKGVVVEARGPNPLVFTATGSVRISGSILLDGQNGTDENAFDSAVTSVPGGAGGAGGGRGGVGQPILHFPVDEISNLSLVSPPTGGRGWGTSNIAQIGGWGGQTGIRDKRPYGVDAEIDCSELQNAHNNGWQPPGGGGGTFLKSGKAPTLDGVGNVLPDGQGGYIVRTPDKGDDLVLLGGAGGDEVFVDEKKNNDFVGVRGELKQIQGGQGGGGGGSGCDSYYCGTYCRYDTDPANDAICLAEFSDPPNFAGAVGDSRGGSGGGGGGAFACRALGDITITKTGVISAKGGYGGGGEALGCSNWAGSGGGGSGGFIGLQSATSITVKSGGTITTERGLGAPAVNTINYITSCTAKDRNSIGVGGNGGHGLIQLQVPFGDTVIAENGNNIWEPSWSDEDNTQNPAEFTPISVGLSTWYDMGRTITNPGAPAFTFHGLDLDGFVMTDTGGNVLDSRSIRCDYLGQEDPFSPGEYRDGEEPRANYIPPNATVKVQFQAADAVTPGSKEVDLRTLSGWDPSPMVANGRQFLRYRIVFDITADSSPLGPETPLPSVQRISIEAEL